MYSATLIETNLALSRGTSFVMLLPNSVSVCRRKSWPLYRRNTVSGRSFSWYQYYNKLILDPATPKGSGVTGHHTQAPAGISFDRFVRACVVVKQLSEAFGRLDTDRDGWVQINYDQFMTTVLALPWRRRGITLQRSCILTMNICITWWRRKWEEIRVNTCDNEKWEAFMRKDSWYIARKSS